MPDPTLEDYLERHTPEWMRLPGVVGTGIGATQEGGPCILVFLSAPSPEVDEVIPDRVEGVPVEVRITGTFRPRGAGDPV